MGFIKNYDALATTSERKVVLDLVETAFASIQPHEVLEKNISLQNHTLKIQDKSFDLSQYERVFILAFGKGSAGIAQLLEQKLDQYIVKGFVIDVTPTEFKKLSFTQGTHPLPSQENLDFTKKVTQELSGLTEKDMVIIVTCGGGSVLFEQPHSLDLEGIKQVNQALLHSGATISEMNAIRKHLSMVKGGGLAKILYPATVFNLLFSDVPGNDLSVIASAPTVKDPTTVEDAWKNYETYKLGEKLSLTKEDFIETPKDDKYFANIHNVMVLSNDTALKAMQQKAQELGYKAEIVSDKFQGDAKEAGKLLLEKSPSGQITLFGGETTVHVKGTGQGGRNQTTVLASLPYLSDDTIIVSFDSDGWDYLTLAGALADKHTAEKAKQMGVNFQEYLDNDDSLAFFQKVGDGIDTGRLASNVSDLMIVLKK